MHGVRSRFLQRNGSSLFFYPKDAHIYQALLLVLFLLPIGCDAQSRLLTWEGHQHQTPHSRPRSPHSMTPGGTARDLTGSTSSPRGSTIWIMEGVSITFEYLRPVSISGIPKHCRVPNSNSNSFSCTPTPLPLPLPLCAVLNRQISFADELELPSEVWPVAMRDSERCVAWSNQTINSGLLSAFF